MSKPRRTEPIPAAPIECPCGNTIHFTMGAPDRDAGGRLICSTCKWGAPPVPAAVVVPSATPIQSATAEECAKLVAEIRALAGAPSLNSAVLGASAHPVSHGGVGYDSIEVVAVDSASISETRPAPRLVTPLTSEETITALAASVERVAAPPSVTARDLERHAVRMRKAGLPVAELDPHERARLSLSRSHRIGCAS